MKLFILLLAGLFTAGLGMSDRDECCKGRKPEKGDCDEQGRAKLRCVKKVFLGPDPSKREKKKIVASYKKLKKNVINKCFKSRCPDAEEIFDEFTKCMRKKMKKQIGKYHDCLEKEEIAIWPEVEGKLDDYLSGTEEALQMKMMQEAKGPFAAMVKSARRLMVKQLVKGVCPNEGKDKLSSKERRKIRGCFGRQLSGGRKKKSGGGDNAFADFLNNMRKAKQCSCKTTEKCDKELDEKKERFCDCVKDSFPKKKIKKFVEKCAKEAKAYDDLSAVKLDFLDQMCSGMEANIENASCA